MLGALALFGLHRSRKTLVVVLNILVLLLELLLQSLDVGFEGLFALFVLALECQDLIVGLRCLTRSGETLLV